jgi:hypothetical protein
MKNSRFTSLIAAAAVSVGALTALIAPASLAQAQPPERIMCWFDGKPYENGTKVDYAPEGAIMCQKDGSWKHIGPGHNNPL